jgi:hypothetical protein
MGEDAGLKSIFHVDWIRFSYVSIRSIYQPFVMRCDTVQNDDLHKNE